MLLMAVLFVSVVGVGEVAGCGGMLRVVDVIDSVVVIIGVISVL